MVRMSRRKEPTVDVGGYPKAGGAVLTLLSLAPPALIVGGTVGILFAVFLVLLLMYRMKKKDEGSYDLGKKPIYKKAPTNEFYA